MFNQPAGFALAGAKTDLYKGVQNAQSVGTIDFQTGEVAAGNALFKCLNGGFLCFSGFFFAAADFGSLKGQNLFGLVNLLVFQSFQTADFINRQIRKNTQAFAHFGVSDIAKILVVVICRKFLFVNPYGIAL